MATQGYYYSNLAVDGFLGASISNVATTIYLVSAPSGYPSQFPFRLVLGGSEAVYVQSGSGTSGAPWVITRGQDGTTAAAWTGGGTATAVQHRATAADFTTSRLHEGSVQADLPHGLPTGAWATAVMATISETVTSGSALTVPITSIPGTYKHLILVINGRGSEAALQSDDVTMTFNGDAGAHYSYVTTSCTNISGSTTGALGAVADATASAVASLPVVRINCSLAGSGVNAGGGWAFIPNYSGATFGKMFWSQSGAGNGSAAMVDYRSRMGWWTPAAQAAITSITLTAPGGGANFFVNGTFVGLYGLS